METWVKKGSPEVTVEAVRLNEDNAEAVASWCKGELVEEIDPENPQEKRPGLNLDTPGGRKRASLHMYVIKYGGRFFVEHNRPFEMLYQPQDRPVTPLESAGDARRERGFADPFDTGRMGP
jgi:hypothetical protein